MADVAGGRARPHRGDAAQQRLVGDLDQPLRRGATARRRTYMRLESPCQPSRIRGDVDIEDVAVAQRLFVGNAVADDVIDRGADRLAVAAIMERGGIGVVVAAELEDELVERGGGDAGPHHRNEQIERLSRSARRPCACLRSPRPRAA